MAQNNSSRDFKDRDNGPENFEIEPDNTDTATTETARTIINTLQQYATEQVNAEAEFQRGVADIRARGLRLFENLLGANAGNTGDVGGNGDRKRKARDDRTKENHDDNGSDIDGNRSKSQRTL